MYHLCRWFRSFEVTPGLNWREYMRSHYGTHHAGPDYYQSDADRTMAESYMEDQLKLLEQAEETCDFVFDFPQDSHANDEVPVGIVFSDAANKRDIDLVLRVVSPHMGPGQLVKMPHVRTSY